MTCTPTNAPSVIDTLRTASDPASTRPAPAIGFAGLTLPKPTNGIAERIESRAVRLKFNNAIQRQRFIDRQMALSKACGGE